MAKSSSVSIKVMDALGNEILQLMNGNLDAGVQNLSFEHGGKLTTGFYFVRVVAGSETVVKDFLSAKEDENTQLIKLNLQYNIISKGII
ncbi:T9SS type A sorting domain-containing protein [Sphingobacterium sp. E70]|nr:T9SS type A sorting domain-containing protein [Sphingobacterium sp. E70]